MTRTRPDRIAAYELLSPTNVIMENDTNFNNDTITQQEYVEEYYRAIIGGMKYQILKLFSEDQAQYSILDERGRDCVHIIIQTRRGDNRVYMSQVTYRPTCAITETMMHGLSTINMVKALLIKVMRDTNVDRIYLKDKSEIDCVLPEDENTVFKISLGMFSFILNGKTWYQKHFGAVVMSESKASAMNVANTLLESPMTPEDAKQLTDILQTELHYYSAMSWADLVMKTAHEIVSRKIGESWRSVLFGLFSDKGSKNIGCLLFEMLRSFLIERFNLPDLTNINMYIMRNTVLSYPETIVIEQDEMPIHIDKKRKEMLFKSSMIMNGVSLYLVGGKKTLKANRIRNMPCEYGRNIIGFLNRRKITKGTRKSNNKI